MGVISIREKSYEKTKEKAKKIQSNGNTLFEIVDEIVQYLLKEKSKLIIDIQKELIKRKELDDIVAEYIKAKNIVIDGIDSYEKIIDSVNDYLWGYSVINKYIDDDLEVSDIAIKGTNDTWIKKNGIRTKTDIVFPSIQSIINFAYSIAIKNGGNLSKRDAVIVIGDYTSSKYYFLRIDIAISPVNVISPHIIIRKIPKYIIKPDMDKLEYLKMFNSEMKNYLIKAFTKGKNILIVGQGASGKTTLLNAGIEHIPESLSKLGIQEIMELSSGKGNWIWETVVKKSGEGDIEYTLQDLATNGLLIDIDWFLIGESKGAESMALFDATFTGHKVALTAHAPSSKQGIEKVILNMKKSGTDYKREDLLRMLSNLDIVIFTKKFKVCEITECVGYDEKANNLKYNPVFKFNIERDDELGIDGYFEKLNESCKI
ncbi:ATPase, T2SS/T4P/T4SS family [Clostridium akagii]|uniref:ATPase, T2SS/T4P/T4SS family n=1 Tax=Clostridium akagii TaxID=91623 RepID=UPI00047C66E8|nr:ATPase, T2SS/T4P/T4SS family [Clostridium akagii]